MRTTCCGKSDARCDDCVDILLMFGYSALEQGSAHLKYTRFQDLVNPHRMHQNHVQII
jgi:hypothetical protein